MEATFDKESFAKRFAETIGKHDDLTPELLEDEFHRMDANGDGELSKEELKSVMGDKMDLEDFEAMFVAMDVDHSGTIKFSEFCTFITDLFANLDK